MRRLRLRSWLAPKPHPVTGDMLSAKERAMWRLMGIYRTLWVVGGLQVVTVLWWVFPQWFPGGLFGWNLLWSKLAVDVEMTVGIAVFGQMLRDSVVTRAELRELKAMHEEAAAERAEHRAVLAEIAEKVGVDHG